MPQNDNPTSGNPYVKAFHDLMATSKDFTQFLADPGERQGIRQGFTDAVNRGAVAATLGAPVDMANMGLNLGKAAVGYLGNKAGVLSADQMPQLIDNPVGGSEYIGNQLQRFGMVSPNRNALAEGLAGVLPTSPTKSAKAVAAIAGGGVVPGMDLAATVFHGSPHKFDRFDSSKIGTGEGAQAYGHGLYLAEAPDVAKQYADNVKDMGAIKDINARLSQLAAEMDKYRGAEYGKFRDSRGYELKAQYDALMDSRSGVAQAPGQLYKVDLPDEAIAKMLDWDKPLSQQAPEVQKALADEAQKYTKRGAKVPDAGMMVRAMQPQERFGGSAAVSEMLRSQGIPGIRYLDGGSRGAGQGTSNYVVFPGNENMLRILERNGQVLK